jgi:predicted nucleotidyltransferase
MDRDGILRLLTQVGCLLESQGQTAELYVVGGAAMALTLDSRRTTADIDASVSGASDAFWAAVETVGRDNGLPPDWLNTTATMFFTNEPDSDAVEFNMPGLRVLAGSAKHLIAMKLRALRERDMDDLEVLFRAAGVTTPEQAAAVHDQLFDDTYPGYWPEDEALFRAREVFARAARLGRPLA